MTDHETPTNMPETGLTAEPELAQMLGEQCLRIFKGVLGIRFDPSTDRDIVRFSFGGDSVPEEFQRKVIDLATDASLVKIADDKYSKAPLLPETKGVIIAGIGGNAYLAETSFHEPIMFKIGGETLSEEEYYQSRQEEYSDMVVSEQALLLDTLQVTLPYA